MEILCFFAGVAFFYQKSVYPFVLLLIMLFFRPKSNLILWFLAALYWCVLHQWLIADQGMPTTNLLKKITLQGYVASIPSQTPTKTQFQFEANDLDGKPVHVTVLLACYQHCPLLHSGEYWRLDAKLKTPRNLGNPGAFDYVGWLSSRHIKWIGTIYKNSAHLQKPQERHYPLLELRERLAKNLALLVPDPTRLGIFEALTLGLTNHIDKAQWDLFRRTGTTHLIDISGEHIALVAGLFYWIFKWLWKHAGQLCLRYPAPKVASLGAMIISIAYTLIAGFAVPTQRSLIACCLMLFRHFQHQRLSVWQTWRYGLFCVLLLEPHSVFMLGFYFSFIAVAILVLINQRIKVTGICKMLSMQLACLLGLMPLSLYWFSYASINSLAANLIAIPFVGFVIVPLALIIAFLSPWIVIPGSVPLLKACLSIFLSCLSVIDTAEFMNIQLTFIEAISPLAIMLALGVVSFMPLLFFFPAAVVLMIASFFPNYEKLAEGAVRMDVLDVGQGLAVVVRTAHHTMIYDTGMKFYQSSDMGKLVIIPYLKTLGIKTLDSVVISHPDLDHRGGLVSLEQNYPINNLLVNDPSFYRRGLMCHDYPSWNWDGVNFRFFAIKKPLKGRNNNCCVLQISNKEGKILLTGDIEKPAEDYLVSTYGYLLASNVMIIPHHGSKTSSSLDFVRKVSPNYAIASYGFDNRYHFPHQETLITYQEHHIRIFNTKDSGLIRVVML